MRSSVWESVSVSHAEPKAGTTMSSPPAGARRVTTFGAAGAGSSAPQPREAVDGGHDHEAGQAGQRGRGSACRRGTAAHAFPQRPRRRSAALLAVRGVAQRDAQPGHEVIGHLSAPIRWRRAARPRLTRLRTTASETFRSLGDLGVVALLDDVRLDGHALIGDEDLDQLAALDPGQALDAGDVLVGELDALHAQPAARGRSA